MKEIARLLVLAIPAMVVGMVLLLDATTFGFRPIDWTSHRAGGCYVVLDDIIGAKAPTAWGRPTELAVACVVILASIAMVLRALWSVWSRRGVVQR